MFRKSRSKKPASTGTSRRDMGHKKPAAKSNNSSLMRLKFLSRGKSAKVATVSQSYSTEAELQGGVAENTATQDVADS